MKKIASVFFRIRNENPFDSSDDSVSNVIKIPNSSCPQPITSLVYIDNYNTVEKIKITGAQSHTTVHRRELKVLAAKSELQFSRVKDLADEIKMKVNNKKTQILCIHSNKHDRVSSYIRADGEEITSGEKLKILGFHFDTQPNAIRHVTEAISSCYNKMWTLRFLKKSGMPGDELLGIYKVIVRAALEYCSVCLLYTSDAADE